MDSPSPNSEIAATDDQTIVAAGEWLVSLCSGRPSLDRDKLLTPLEQLKFNEFFSQYGQSSIFKPYHVEAVRKCLVRKSRSDYQLVRDLLQKDDTNTLFVDENDMLQVAIKSARIDPGFLGQDPRKSCPELVDMVVLLMAHGALINCFDSDGYSALFYACVLGYRELFRFLVASGAEDSTTHRRIPPEQLIKEREAAALPSLPDKEDEQVNLLQVTLDAIISPQNIVDMTWVGWPPGVNYDIPMWWADIEATWGGIILSLMGRGLSYDKDDPGLVMLLHIACFQGSLYCVRQLLDYGVVASVAGPRMVDGGQGQGATFGTAMHAAAAGQKLPIVTTLISHGESVALRRPCILSRGRTKGDLTPVQIAIAAAGYDDDTIMDFLGGFVSQGQEVENSDYEEILTHCIEINNLDFAKRYLERGIRLSKVPSGVKSGKMAQLLTSYDIKLDPTSLQFEALKKRRLDLLRWCVNEYGPLLPSDAKSWGRMARQLLMSSHVDMKFAKYIVTEYPGPHIDSVIIADLKILSDERTPTETSFLHLAIVEDNIAAMHFLLEVGADPTLPGLPYDAQTAMRNASRGISRVESRYLEIIEIMEKKFSGSEWAIPSYAETRSRIAQEVESQRRIWDGQLEYMAKNRQHVPHTTQQPEITSTSPSTLGHVPTVGIYQPLSSSSSFRLLELQPSNSRTDPLVGHLIESDITFRPDFEALSYVWGDINPAKHININDQDVAITPNLHLALIHLRLPDEVRTLWVDALCIDQVFHGERNQQVRIMGDIYKSARQVVVWLGEAADDSHLVFEHLKDDTIEGSFPNNPVPTKEKRRAWNSLVKRPWFFRTWVIQEIALARRAIVMCGDDSTLWLNIDQGWKPDFSGGAKSLSTVNSAPGNKPDHPLAGFDPDSHIWRLRLLHFGSDPMQILRYSRVCQTTEVRDKIYGILGLFKPGFIPVDYDSPVEDIFQRFTEAVITLTGNLRILKHLGVTKSYDGLPSWVPDFTESSTRSLPGHYWSAPYRENAEDEYSVHGVDGQQFNVPREDLVNKYLPGLTFLEGGRLVLKGKAVDTIRDLGPELPEEITYAPGTDAFAEVMKRWESLATTLIPDWKPSLGPSVTHAFAATLSAIDGSELFSLEAGFTQWYRFCGTGVLESTDPRMFLRDNEFYLWWLDLEKKDKENEDSEKLGYDLREFSERMAFASYGRCLFTTDGGSMGLASPLARAGDRIVYFPGAGEPFVLRRRENGEGWTLVNDCYLYGLDLDELFHNSEHLAEDFVIY
ncbi:related to heterokaryon incompatibility protein het-6 [Fusarium torulosum]|uniref:Related to heterokaryon incompatibility protein het-6 n=1 Tax=Fusarium torulosum TaxID=33205 RepID=A0AAE8M179_9HYPO|nr:related to heterokaryon incompatibility protein het-6 [Fusarium torulosum]